MKNRGIVLVVILIVAGLIIAGFAFREFMKKTSGDGNLYDKGVREKVSELLTNKSSGGSECAVDSDCVPATCCHAKNCIAKKDGPKCEGIYCTMSCEPETLDCNQGSCICENKRCKAVIIW